MKYHDIDELVRSQNFTRPAFALRTHNHWLRAHNRWVQAEAQRHEERPIENMQVFLCVLRDLRVRTTFLQLHHI
jgi:uncharacterized protein YecT (DUF1311 family)